jgi:hypothetical protein
MYIKKTVELMSNNFTDSKKFRTECLKSRIFTVLFIIVSVITIFIPFGNIFIKIMLQTLTLYIGYKLIKQAKKVKNFKFFINNNNLYDYSLYETTKGLEKEYVELFDNEDNEISEEVKKEGIPDIKLNSDGINELFTTAFDILKEDISEIVKNKVLEIKKISEKYMEITDRKPEIIENLKSKIKKGTETADIFELYRLVKNLKIVPDILLPYIMYSYISCFGNEEQIKYFRVMRTPELLEKSVNNIEILKSITENKEMLKFEEAGEMRNMYSIKETVNKTVENYLGFSSVITKYNIEKFITEDMDFNI